MYSPSRRPDIFIEVDDLDEIFPLRLEMTLTT